MNWPQVTVETQDGEKQEDMKCVICNNGSSVCDGCVTLTTPLGGVVPLFDPGHLCISGEAAALIWQRCHHMLSHMSVLWS